ncbi:MAG: hypothetical protein JW883_00375 [Deltaproteobacteria bacterium]|nr:hypothetical protein [Deltaproteobacteria bacterium]
MSNVDKSVCLDILEWGLRNSWYYYQSGQLGKAYYSLDTAILGDDFETKRPPQHEVIKALVEQSIIRIHEIERQEPFDRLAFIDKAGHGPVGMIALSSFLIMKSKKDGMYVRPYRRTLRSMTRGKRPNVGEKILIVSDVATTGQTILKAASKLWEAGAVVTGALVVFDQDLGATENLRVKDIPLYSLITRNEAQKAPNRNITFPEGEAVVLREFGGVM